MFIFIDWAIISLITGLFLLVYFTDIRIKSTKVYSSLRVHPQVEYVMDGIFYGGLFSVFYLSFNNLSFHASIFLVAGILLTLTKDYRVSLIGLLFPFIIHVATNPITDGTYITISMTFSFIFIQVFVAHFVDFPRERQVSLSVLFFFALILFATFSGIWADALHSFKVTLLPTLLIIYSYVIISYSIRTSESANALYKTINYTFSNYYRNTMKELVILNLVSKKQVRYGIYCLLDIEILETQSKNHKNEILESVLLDLESIIPSSSLLFKSKQNYGFFIPVNKLGSLPVMINGNKNLMRTDNDSLLFAQKIIESIPSSYQTTASSINDVKVRGGVALYGIQNQSISELDNMAEYAMRVGNKKRGNVINLFEPNSYRKRINDSEDLKNLNARIGLDNFNIKYQGIHDLKNDKKKYVIARQQLISDTMIISSLVEFKSFNKATATFDRYFSALSIKNYKEKNDFPLIIRYSPIILNDLFDISEFIVFVDNSNIDPSQIILEFSDSDFEEITDIKLMNQNIDKLKDYGVRIAVFMTTQERTSMIKMLNPSILVFNDLDIAKLAKSLVPKADTIILDLALDTKFDEAKKIGLNNYSGTLIEGNK